MNEETLLDEGMDPVVDPAPQETSAPTVPDILTSVSDMINDALSSISDDQQPGQPIVIVNQESASPSAPDDGLLLADPTPAPVEDVWIYDEDYGLQTYTLNPVTSADGLKGVMLDVLGSYDAIVIEHRYQNPNSSSYNYVREIQPDFPWLISAALFIVVLYSCIRLGAALLCKK